MNRLDRKQILIGTILGITLSILTLILLTRNIQPLSAQQQTQKYTVFKTQNEGFKFLRSGDNRSYIGIQFSTSSPYLGVVNATSMLWIKVTPTTTGWLAFTDKLSSTKQTTGIGFATGVIQFIKYQYDSSGRVQNLEFAPIFAQTPTENSPGNQVATKEYVDMKTQGQGNYPYWILAESSGIRYLIPAIRSPQLVWTDWVEWKSNTGIKYDCYPESPSRSKCISGDSGTHLLGETKFSGNVDLLTKDVSDMTDLNSGGRIKNIHILNQIKGKQIYKIEVYVRTDGGPACGFAVLGKMGIIWSYQWPLPRNPLGIDINYNKVRDEIKDINLGDWWSRKDIRIGSITSDNYNYGIRESSYSIDFLGKPKDVKQIFNSDGGVEDAGYIKSFPANNYLILDGSDQILLDSFMSKRKGNGSTICKIRFQYYDSYMPTNVINPANPIRF